MLFSTFREVTFTVTIFIYNCVYHRCFAHYGDREPVRLSKINFSKGQQRRVNRQSPASFKKRPRRKADYDDNLFGEPAEGNVISRFGMYADAGVC